MNQKKHFLLVFFPLPERGGGSDEQIHVPDIESYLEHLFTKTHESQKVSIETKKIMFFAV